MLDEEHNEPAHVDRACEVDGVDGTRESELLALQDIPDAQEDVAQAG